MNPYLAEVLGTAILILFGGGVVANVSLTNSKAEGGGWIVVAVAWGFAVMLAVYAVGQFSGGHFNPAVSLGLAVIGDFPWHKVVGYIFCQLVGAFIGATLVWLHFLPHFNVTENENTKRDVFCTSPALPNYVANILSEMIGTMILVMGVLFIGINNLAAGLNPMIVGFLIMAIGLSLGGTTGYAINPARDLGPRIAHYVLPIANKGHSNWQYAFVPVLGPLVGGMLGASLYSVLFRGTNYGWLAVSLVFVVLALLVGHIANNVFLKGQAATIANNK